MKIAASQIYIQPGASFPFSSAFQKWLSEELSQSTTPSEVFCRKYGEDWDLIFRISAKAELANSEIRGPTVYKKARDVEFTIFLPFGVIQQKPEPLRAAMQFLFDGVLSVLDRLGIDTAALAGKRDAMIERAVTDGAMLRKQSSEPAATS